MTSSGVTTGPCRLKFSPYIIGELVIMHMTAINNFGAMVTKNNSSRIIAHANWQFCDFHLLPTYDLAYKKHVFESFNNKIVFVKTFWYQKNRTELF